MWILRYEYDLENGEIVKVSCCLKHGEAYNVGRSSKNLLNVKNDKSISRQHVIVSWDSRDCVLKLVNQGKMTATSNKYLKMGESITFDKSTKKAVLELGTKPLKVELEWIEAVWLIPADNTSLHTHFSGLGIEILSSGLNVATLMVIDEGGHYSRRLYGLARRIPLMKPEFLNYFEKAIATHETEFDVVWSNVLNDRQFLCNAWGTPDNPLQTLEFLTIGNDNEASLAIEAAGGKYSAAQSIEILQEELAKRENTGNVVILRHTYAPTEEFKKLGKTFVMEDVVKAVLDGEIDTLKDGVVKPAPKRQDTEAPVGKPIAKKRRLNRPRIKPLDILSFFAGGESIKESQRDSTIKLNSQERESTEAPKETNTELKEEPKEVPKKLIEESKGNSSYDLPDEKKRSTSETAEANPIAPEPASTQEAPIQEAPTQEAATQVTSVQVPPAPKPTPEPVRTSKDSNSASTRRPPTLSDYKKIDTSTQNDMIQMIQDTKSREIKRLNSTIVQVGEEELTEAAINELGNLVLVDRNDQLLRRRDKSPTVDSHNSDWNNRKNFKKFVKVWPKYRRQEDASMEGSSDTIRNRAFLLTRQYVPTRPYTGNEPSNQVQENMYDFPEPQDEEEPPVEGPGPNNLFVMDDEDSQDIVLEEPPRQTAPHPASRLINSDSEDDDDDDEPKFQFKRRRR